MENNLSGKKIGINAKDSIIIYGNGGMSQSLFIRLTQEFKGVEVKCFTVEKAYLNSSMLLNIPVIPFEYIESEFSPLTSKFLMPIGYMDHNRVREKIYYQTKAKGFNFLNYISPKSIISDDIHFSDNTLIYEGAILEPFVKIGFNSIIRSNTIIGHHTKIGSNVFIASGVNIAGNVTISDNCFIGIGATISNNITLHEGSIIGAGAVVISDAESYSTYVGNPSRKV